MTRSVADWAGRGGELRMGSGVGAGMSAVIVRVAMALIRAYQCSVRLLFVGSCKFCPSCSDYAIEALRVHGPLRGSWLAVRRLARCHPFGPGGIDPVPTRKTTAES